MTYLPFADINVSTLSIFIIGLIAGIMGGVFGNLVNLVIVPVLNIFGLPLTLSVSTSLGHSFGRSSFLIFSGNACGPALRRVGTAAGIAGLPGILLGFKLHLLIINTGYGEIFITLCYIVLILSAFLVLLRQWLFFNRHDYYEDAPFPPIGLNWRFPLAIPGGSGTKHITLLRITLVGLLLGTAAGLLGIGAGILGVPLFMYILGLPFRVAAATDSITMLIVGSAAFFSYALAGRVEFVAVFMLLAAVTLGSRIGSLLPGDLNFSHVRLAFSGLMAVVALSYAVSLGSPAFSYLIVAVTGSALCSMVIVLSLVPDNVRPGKIARLLKSIK